MDITGATAGRACIRLGRTVSGLPWSRPRVASVTHAGDLSIWDAVAAICALTRRSVGRIDATRQFLGDLQGGATPDDWVMCYPHGSYDAVTLELFRASGCAAGLSLKPGVLEALDAPLGLPRLDTNDLPSGAAAEPRRWTRHVLASFPEN